MNLTTWIADDHRALRERFEQQILASVPAERFTEYPQDAGNSIAWLIWHLARHEDISINSIVRGRQQVFEAGGWANRLGVPDVPPGLGIGETEDRDLSLALDLAHLDAYWQAVTRETRTWLGDLTPDTLDDVPDAVARLADVARISEGDFPWLYRMWAGKPVAFFVRWEAIGHPYTHVGEMTSIRGRMGLSPF